MLSHNGYTWMIDNDLSVLATMTDAEIDELVDVNTENHCLIYPHAGTTEDWEVVEAKAQLKQLRDGRQIK